ncbi:ATP-grasp fold amidoligase family protein [Paraburkholderia sp. BR13444]|uniref:ATP-grasp fold amidoligase family protein n=1 Tax=Paraburkholderia sp. BR13444 TaxID=3236997 RepID=UPI0034CE8B17
MTYPSQSIIQWTKDNAKQLLPDAVFLSLLHRKRIGRFPKLFHPTTYNEKILLRCLRPDSRYSALTDKLTVRDYVREKIGEKYLIPIISAPSDFTQNIFDMLPNSFVMKANHGNNFVEIVRDKSQQSFEHLQLLASQWLSTNFYKNARERHYRGIQPRIYFENLLLDEHGMIPADYKVHCFANGSGRPVMFIFVISDRFGSNTRGDTYDAQWNRIDLEFAPYVRSTRPAPRPNNLELLLDTAAHLSEGFDYVRVDLYSPSDRVFFGELTFTPGAGVSPMLPDRVDYEWGRLLT